VPLFQSTLATLLAAEDSTDGYLTAWSLQMLYNVPLFFRSISHHTGYDDISPMDPQEGFVLSHSSNNSGERKDIMFSI